MFFKIIYSTIFIVTILNSSNHLKNETSPYLLQHKDNPVNWYPWGKEAFHIAKKQNKLIFLSIGYSTCHWCHIMAEESFEDKELAKLLNKYFISIKVDKEQYPHIDKYYQKVYQIMNQKSGGWPLSIFLTPEKKPFFSATYIPQDDGYGQLGFTNLLNKIISIPKREIKISANKLDSYIKKFDSTNTKIIKIDNKLVYKTIKEIQSYYDNKYGGFSKNRKFPQASKIKLLLKIYQITKNKTALLMATKTLDIMAKSGIFDQIEGGFFRYTIDRKWNIPHFEKMLYTNAQLLEVYTLAYKITKKSLYKTIVQRTIQNIDEKFQSNNLYKSASNADSKNEQGKNEEGYYFVYQYDKILEYLEKNHYAEKQAIKNLHYLNITSDGNFQIDLSHTKIRSHIIPQDINKTIVLLKRYRQTKEYPFIDNKINVAWNSLYLQAKLEASIINKKYLKQALKSLDTLIERLYIDDELYHQTIEDFKPTQKGLLEDYSFLATTLFQAYQLSLDKKYFFLYEKLIKQSIKIFYKNNRWRLSQDDFVTYANIDSGSYKNDLANHMINIIIYSSLKAKPKMYKIAKDTLNKFSTNINNYPSYYPTATLAFLMQKFEPVFIKAKSNKLKTIDLNSIDYPFIYIYEENSNLYLACKINNCFSYSKNFKKVKQDIENLF